MLQVTEVARRRHNYICVSPFAVSQLQSRASSSITHNLIYRTIRSTSPIFVVEPVFDKSEWSIYKNALLLAQCWSETVRCHYSRDIPVTASPEANHAGMLELRSCCCCVCCLDRLYLLRHCACSMRWWRWTNVSSVAQISCGRHRVELRRNKGAHGWRWRCGIR